ncbi:hypothetical protein DesLBE_2710 [Desulfitobacterium sp. LBE]|uniref:hypothetical protein n=1 Tax=Desulfitobacterium sp. LBE TaxID=884086 RepID=UPI00119B071A|nr:hypothetical protein [Desulfitobacterium sp. LBE]TWH58392.1 hypothetical protein DesLBE_2710 [Desulfitobacterium sp. LBE]
MNEEILDQIISELRKVNRDKRIRDIQEYILERFPESKCRISTPSDLYNYKDLDFNEEDIEIFFKIINQSYSLGEPYFIVNFHMKPDEGVDALVAEIIKSLEKGADVSDEYKFTAAELVGNPTPQEGRLRIYYNEFALVRTREGVKRVNEENPISYGYVDINFLKEKQIIMINVGHYVLARWIKVYIEKNFYKSYEVGLSFFKIKRNLFKYDGPIDFDPVTVFLLELVTNTLEDTDHRITNHKQFGFENLKSKQVKTVKLGGQDLIESESVADQVENGFKLKSVEFGLEIAGHPVPMNASVAIYAGAAVKINIKEIDNKNYAEDFILYVWEKVSGLLSIGITVPSGQSIIAHYFPCVVSRLRLMIQITKNEILAALLRHPTLNSHGDLINEIVEKV